jgi:hypothetical protein
MGLRLLIVLFFFRLSWHGAAVMVHKDAASTINADVAKLKAPEGALGTQVYYFHDLLVRSAVARLLSWCLEVQIFSCDRG